MIDHQQGNKIFTEGNDVVELDLPPLKKHPSSGVKCLDKLRGASMRDNESKYSNPGSSEVAQRPI